MRILFVLFVLAIIGLGFWVWRTIARSPKLDGIFDFQKKDEDADDILARRRAAEQDLDVRGRTLDKAQVALEKERSRIRKNQQ